MSVASIHCLASEGSLELPVSSGLSLGPCDRPQTGDYMPWWDLVWSPNPRTTHQKRAVSNSLCSSGTAEGGKHLFEDGDIVSGGLSEAPEHSLFLFLAREGKRLVVLPGTLQRLSPRTERPGCRWPGHQV